MEKVSLDAVAEEQLDAARRASAGRAAHTCVGGRDRRLRQTVLALRAGHELAEHDNPGEATLIVLRGRVRLDAGDVSQEGSPGDLLVIPPSRHGLVAVEDSAILLTVVVAGAADS